MVPSDNGTPHTICVNWQCQRSREHCDHVAHFHHQLYNPLCVLVNSCDFMMASAWMEVHRSVIVSSEEVQLHARSFADPSFVCTHSS